MSENATALVEVGDTHESRSTRAARSVAGLGKVSTLRPAATYPDAGGRDGLPSPLQLLKNATEASDGGCKISVRLRPTVEGGTLVEVLDRGRGMTEEVMRQALLPLYSTKPSGSGVGLPLCHEIVEAHGGKLSIQLRQGGGTVVSCWLPPERRQSP